MEEKQLITIEPTERNDVAMCDCCGRSTSTVWGYAYVDDEPFVAYFVHWAPGHVDDTGANFDLIVGKWGDGTTSDDCRAVALAYRLVDTIPSAMAIDSQSRPFAQNELVGHPLGRAQVVGTPLAKEVFAVFDAILAQDDRITDATR